MIFAPFFPSSPPLSIPPIPSALNLANTSLSLNSPHPSAHLQFNHCYKGQQGWRTHLSRFVRSGGILYDIEFLTDNVSVKRVAAFGY
jgi:saccharopine dehydrogenase (NAD+, L-lysine forming)